MVTETLAAGLIAVCLAQTGLLAWKYVPRPRAPKPPGDGAEGAAK
jgi:hypothetical protein